MRLSLEEKIDRFQLEEGREDPRDLIIHLLDEEDELDRTSSVRAPCFIVARIDSSTEEEEKMALNRRKGLRDLFTDRAKGQTSKDALGS